MTQTTQCTMSCLATSGSHAVHIGTRTTRVMMLAHMLADRSLCYALRSFAASKSRTQHCRCNHETPPTNEREDAAA